MRSFSTLSVQWCRRRGVQMHPKSVDFSKIWAKSLKIRAKSMKSGKIPKNPGKIHEILGKILETRWKNGAQRCLIFKNGAQRLQKNRLRPLLEVIPTERSPWSLWEKICREKLHKNFSGKFGEFRSKMLRTPKNLPAPTPMSRPVLFRIAAVGSAGLTGEIQH